MSTPDPPTRRTIRQRMAAARATYRAWRRPASVHDAQRRGREINQAKAAIGYSFLAVSSVVAIKLGLQEAEPYVAQAGPVLEKASGVLEEAANQSTPTEKVAFGTGAALATGVLAAGALGSRRTRQGTRAAEQATVAASYGLIAMTVPTLRQPASPVADPIVIPVRADNSFGPMASDPVVATVHLENARHAGPMLNVRVYVAVPTDDRGSQPRFYCINRAMLEAGAKEIVSVRESDASMRPQNGVGVEMRNMYHLNFTSSITKPEVVQASFTDHLSRNYRRSTAESGLPTSRLNAPGADGKQRNFRGDFGIS